MKFLKIGSLILVAAGVIASLWITSKMVTPRDADWDVVAALAESGGYHVIKTDELWQRVQADPAGTLLVDAREAWHHAAGHIAGSINFPMRSTGFSRKLRAEALAKVLGPDKDRFVAFY